MSSRHTGCSCPACQECCRREPGWFVPAEIVPASDLLNCSEEDFLEQYCEEHVEDGFRAFSPARKPGKNECVFLRPDGLCAIHPVKPYECRKVFGCESAARHRRIREIIARMWK